MKNKNLTIPPAWIAKCICSKLVYAKIETKFETKDGRSGQRRDYVCVDCFKELV